MIVMTLLSVKVVIFLSDYKQLAPTVIRKSKLPTKITSKLACWKLHSDQTFAHWCGGVYREIPSVGGWLLIRH